MTSSNLAGNSEWRSGWGTLCSEENWQGRPSDRHFQETYFVNLDSCIFPYLEKRYRHQLKCLFLMIRSNLPLKCVLDCTHPLYQNTGLPLHLCTAVASDLILVVLDGGQYSLFYDPFPFSLNFDQGLRSSLWLVCPMALGMLIPR